ncbi:MAG: DUF2914 domain-containing protein [Candidatus Acidiferrales bacterium]
MPPEHLTGTFFGNVRSSYTRIARPLSSLSLLGGFVFDALTLKRIDMFWENLWVIVHLVVAGACIVLANRAASAALASPGTPGPSDATDAHETPLWIVGVLQFSFGGLLSTFLVFYFRSGSLLASWPFLLLLAAAFLANESLKKHYARLEFQASFFFLSLFAFAIFIVPVVLHTMGPLIFLLSGALSVVLFRLFLRVLRHAAPVSYPRERKVLFISVAGIFLAINILYYLNLIPPIPLSLRDADVEHSISRNAQGDYVVQSERASWLGYFKRADEFHCVAGAPVYAYTAVFSPTSLHTDIVHVWQTYDEKRGWITTNRIELPLSGGRGGGYRTFSMTNQIRAGAWRVNVETPRGALLGRLRFNVILQSGEPALQTEIKN